MSFLHPALFAAGLACVSIPIIIHLLMRRRRKPVRWAAMRFLLEAYKRQRRRLRLEQFLLLAARCLLLLLVALALGRPLFGKGSALAGTGPTTVYLLIDNSMTSGVTGTDDVSALERHQEQAGRILAQMDEARGDRASVIALGGPAQPVVLPASGDLTAVRRTVDELTPTDSGMDLEGAAARLRAELEGEPSADNTLVVVLSDFLLGSADTSRSLQTLGAVEGVRVVASSPASAGESNVTITGVDPLRSVVVAGRVEAGEGADLSGSTQVRVSLRRSGATDTDTTTVLLQFEGAGETVPLGRGVVRWAPGQTEATVAITADARALRRAIGAGVLAARIDNDALARDNVYRKTVELRESLRVGIVSPRRFGRTSIDDFSPSDWARLALGPTEGVGASDEIELVQIEPSSIDASRLGGLDALIVARPDLIDAGAWARLRRFVDAGGLLFVSAPPIDLHLWTDPFADEMGLRFEIAREPTDFETPAPLSGETGASESSDLLALVSAELEDLARPVRVMRALGIDNTQGDLRTLLSLESGEPLLVAQRPTGARGIEGRGLVVLLATALDLEWTDLPARPLMVPLMQETVRQGVGIAQGSWTSPAGSTPASPPLTVELRPIAGESARTVELTPGESELRPQRFAGAWRALDDGGVTRGVVVVNPDARAGRTDAQGPGELTAWLSQLAGDLTWLSEEPTQANSTDEAGLFSSADDRSPFSVPLLIAALIVALIEVVLARYTSHAFAERTPKAEGAAA